MFALKKKRGRERETKGGEIGKERGKGKDRIQRKEKKNRKKRRKNLLTKLKINALGI